MGGEGAMTLLEPRLKLVGEGEGETEGMAAAVAVDVPAALVLAEWSRGAAISVPDEAG